MHSRRRKVARDYIQDALLLASRTRAWAATRPSNRVAIARRLLVGGIMYGIVGSGRACAVRSALLRVWWTVVVAAHCVWGRAVADRAFAGTVRRRRFAAVCVRVCGGLHRLERARRMTTMTNARAYGTQPQPQPQPQSQAESPATQEERGARTSSTQVNQRFIDCVLARIARAHGSDNDRFVAAGRFDLLQERSACSEQTI